MSRSVSYPTDALVVFKDASYIEDEFEWEYFVDDLKEMAVNAFPSLTECDEWLGREDHAILENNFAYFGLSEYCGLVSVWFVLKDFDTYYEDEQRLENLSENWLSTIEDKFRSLFGELRKVAVFSNGETLYERV